MIISQVNNYIFIAVPKTGSTSIEEYLLKNDKSARQNVFYREGEAYSVGKHISAKHLQKKMGQEFLRYRRFGFVRHPYSKLISLYDFYRNGRAYRRIVAGYPKGKKNRNRAKSYLARSLNFPLWSVVHPARSCSSFLADRDGNLLVNYIGSYEKLEDHFFQILEKLGVPAKGRALGHRNRSTGSFSAPNVSIRLLKTMINARYKADITLCAIAQDGIDGPLTIINT